MSGVKRRVSCVVVLLPRSFNDPRVHRAHAHAHMHESATGRKISLSDKSALGVVLGSLRNALFNRSEGLSTRIRMIEQENGSY